MGVDKGAETGGDVRALTHVLDSLAGVAGGDEVSVGELVDALGRRSFPALILAPCLIAVSPASGIPGLTSMVGLFVATISAQMLWGRHCVWVPDFLARRRIASARLRGALAWLRRPIAFIERLSKPRLVALVTRPLVALPLVVMLAIALMMPLLEIVPTSGSIAAALISAYAVGLLMRDGVLVLLALGVTAGAPLGVWHLLT